MLVQTTRTTVTNNVPASHLQAYRVAQHLIDLGTISNMEATSLYRVSSLTKVISVLRNNYHLPIVKVFKKDHTEKRYARYYLVAA